MFSSRAPIGLVAIAGRPMCTNQGFKSLIPGPEVDSGFLYYALKRLVPQIQAMGNGATFKEVSKEVMERVELPLPKSVSEQRRIAAILDKADAIRRKRRQALAETDTLLRSVFLDMFGDPTRLATASITLADVAHIARGRFSPRPRNDPKYYGGEYPFIQTGDIASADGYLHEHHQTLNENGVKVSKFFDPGTVLIAIVGATIGETAIASKRIWCPIAL